MEVPRAVIVVEYRVRQVKFGGGAPIARINEPLIENLFAGCGLGLKGEIVASSGFFPVLVP